MKIRKKEKNNIIMIYNLLFKPFIFEQVMCSFLLLIYSITSILFPYFLKLIIDDAIGKKDVNKLIIITIIMLTTIILMIITNYLQAIKFLKLGQKVIYKLKQIIMDKLMCYTDSFFRKYQNGEIVSIIENDVSSVENLATYMISDFIVSIITALGLFIVLFKMDYQIALISIVLVLGYTYLQRKLGFKIENKSMELSKNRGKLLANTQEIINNIAEIKIINSNEYFISNYKQKQKKYFQKEKDVLITRQLTMIFGNIFQCLGLVVVLCFGGYKVLQEQMTLGVLFSLTIYIQRIYSPIIKVTNTYVEFNRTKASIKRIFTLINKDEYVIEDGLIAKDKIVNSYIEFKNFTFGYGKEFLVKNANVKIKKGEKIAVLGKNGTGKTTLLKILLKMKKEYTGEILFDKSNIKELKLGFFRKNIICIGQKPFIFNGTILENILINKKTILKEDDIKKILRLACLEDDLKYMSDGLDTLIGEKGVSLSGGQAQKIAIARAFVFNPSILILDEPTSALDLELEKTICKNIFDYFSDRTIITITHRREILKYCTRVLEISNKTIQEKVC